jgi:hypothetical protein
VCGTLAYLNKEKMELAEWKSGVLKLFLYQLVFLYKALEEFFWISQIKSDVGLLLEHIVQFANLWEMLQAVQLEPNTPDSIKWKRTNDKCYSAKSA